MLSLTAEYAIRAALFLARQPAGRTVKADAIARALGAPANYMAKTLNALAKTGIVEGVRGPHGGFRLMADPTTLTVARLVEAFDERPPHSRCLLGGRRCDSAEPCRAHDRWRTVQQSMREPLAETTLADLLSGDAVEFRAAV